MTTPQTLEDLLGETPPAGQSGAQTDGSKLRTQLEQVLADNKALRERVETADARDRESKVNGLFEKHSIPTLAKDFFPKDADLTDESVTAFVEKYGLLWGAQAAEAAATPEQQAAAAQLQQLSAGSMPPPTGLMNEEAARAKYAEANTAEDVMRMVAEATTGYTVLE